MFDSEVTNKNRGEYIIKAVAHCSACHSPRIWLSIIKDHENLNGKIETHKLLNDGAPNISKDKIEGIVHGLNLISYFTDLKLMVISQDKRCQKLLKMALVT